MNQHNKINYLEIPANDLEATKKFFTEVFGWSFVDYGPEYCSLVRIKLDNTKQLALSL